MTRETMTQRLRRLGLAALLGTTATLHVTQRRWYERMVPDWVPGDPVAWNVAATVAEGGSALLLLTRKTAGVGGAAAAGTLLAVWPANIQHAVDGRIPVRGWAGTKQVAWARVPLQVPLIQWALRVRRDARAVPSIEEDST